VNYIEYLKFSAQSILQSTYVYDHARSAERLTDHLPINKEVGPYLASHDADLTALSACYLFISIEMQAAFNVSKTGRYDQSPAAPNGRIPLELDLLPTLEGSRVTPYVAKTAIVEQFELLKKYLIYVNAPYNVKMLEKSREILDVDIFDKMERLILRRNELTHEIDAPMASMKNAVEYFYSCRWLATFFHENSP